MQVDKPDELIGKRFGHLVVIELDENATLQNKGHAKSYKCKCDCGNIKTVRANNLKSGQTSSCGCFRRENMSAVAKTNEIDLTGQRFGKLVVTRKKEKDINDPIKDKRLGVWWYADCDCGKKDVIVKGAYLRSGHVQSCGCYNKEASHDKNVVNLIGRKFGLLTVIEEVPDIRDNKSIVWLCECECGNKVLASSKALRDGKSSCGCLVSKNENIIKKYLKENNINFIPQYWFDDLRSPITGWILKYDVAVFDEDHNLSFIIEYDGEQHEQGCRFSTNKQENEEKFRRLQLYDEIKTQYCKEHNIDLLRISFKEKDKLIEIIDNKLRQKGLV